jgi:hypothetical protein
MISFPVVVFQGNDQSTLIQVFQSLVEILRDVAATFRALAADFVNIHEDK